MVPRLHVALVYNMKKENADEVSHHPRSEETGESGVAVASRTKLQETRHDTYAEWDSEATILAVKAALAERHSVTMIEATDHAPHQLLEVQPDIVFNIAEGLRGPSREAQIPAVLEMLGIPYTGSDPVTLGICLDKARAKEILSFYKIPTPEFHVISSLEELHRRAIAFPSVVKPLHEGSSKGVLNASIVRTQAELVEQVRRVLNDYSEPALVEKFLPGREFTVALLGNGPTLRVFPIVEILLDKLPPGVNPLYSYEAKWVWDQVDHPVEMYNCPARIDSDLERRIKETCLNAFRVLRCRDWCRIDLRLDDHGIPSVIELNPLPGILPNPDDHSSYPMAARSAGLSYNTMLNAVLDEAILRYGMHNGKSGNAKS
ncbi:MAG: ATP-grasp domain-containing protein [Ignavibacteriales bacterium]|nr:ATP-grasp domain-containing protein [Ignavibacteriales bacterium]